MTTTEERTTALHNKREEARKRLLAAEAALNLAKNELSIATRNANDAEAALKREKHLIQFNGFVLLWDRPHLGDGYWFESEDGRLVRADHSGDDCAGKTRGPLATDDGPLYVVTTKKAVVLSNPRTAGRNYTINVTKQNGSEYGCILGSAAADWLFARHPQMIPSPQS